PERVRRPARYRSNVAFGRKAVGQGAMVPPSFLFPGVTIYNLLTSKKMNGQTQFTQIVKRSGDVAEFEPEKIEQAIFKAMRAAGRPDRAAARRLTGEVIAELAAGGERIPHVERVQDAVEQAIYRSGDFELLKTYMLYRKKHEE